MQKKVSAYGLCHLCFPSGSKGKLRENQSHFVWHQVETGWDQVEGRVGFLGVEVAPEKGFLCENLKGGSFSETLKEVAVSL